MTYVEHPAIIVVTASAIQMLALRWLSRWLQDRWHLFGFYCLAASMLVFEFG